MSEKERVSVISENIEKLDEEKKKMKDKDKSLDDLLKKYLSKDIGQFECLGFTGEEIKYGVKGIFEDTKSERAIDTEAAGPSNEKEPFSGEGMSERKVLPCKKDNKHTIKSTIECRRAYEPEAISPETLSIIMTKAIEKLVEEKADMNKILHHLVNKDYGRKSSIILYFLNELKKK